MSEEHRDHPQAAVFLFEEDRHTAVFICDRVLKKESAVLFVSHDEDGAWQFLCGGQHGHRHEEDPARIVCLEHVVASDPSLNDLADMCTRHWATRNAPDQPWSIADETESQITALIESRMWWVGMIEGEPPFAYTVGLQRLFDHPEVIVLGLPHDAAIAILNTIGERVRDGERFENGAIIRDILQGDLELRLRSVTSRQSYRDHVGYALWFYGGDKFRLFQCLWPDKANLFPGEEGFALDYRQPLL
jgi:hypothetical protein